MSLNLETQYPGKINPSDADYPYGSARNITVPGDGTGTPWEQAIVNDNIGFQQSLLTAAGIVPSGSPDKVGESQFLQALLSISGRTELTTITMASMKEPKVGQLVTTLEFDTGNGLNSGAPYVGVLTSSGTPNGTDFIVSTEDALISFQLRTGTSANVKHFGAKGTGADDTVAVRAAAAYLKALGGGSLYFPDGTYALSTGDAPAYCLRIPANVRVFGESKAGTIITRLVLEEVSILFVNDDADTATGYAAAGNITIEHLTMTDSVTNTERNATNGDLIAFGHGDGLIVRDCHFGNHTQHCLDIGGSKNILFAGNTQLNSNGATGFAENSAVQVDSANGAAFLGLNIDGTETEQVTITDNRFINTNTNTLLHVGHNGGTAKNVIIANNYFEGTSRSFGKFIRTDVDDASIDGLIIKGNTFNLTTQANLSAVSIITNGNNSESFKNVVISNNTIVGLARIGIDFGGSESYLGANLPSIENINISDNTLDLDFTGAATLNVGIKADLCKASSIRGNNIKIFKDTDDVDMFGIRSITSTMMDIIGNTILTGLTTFTGANLSAGIKVDRFGSIATSALVDISVIDNNLDVTKLDYGIHHEFLVNGNTVLLSGNRFSGDLVNGDAHIFESIPTSDGSNGYRSIDLTGAGGYTLPVAIDTSYAITTGLIKKAGTNTVRSIEKIDINYTSLGASSLSTVTEQFFDDANIALQVSAIDPSAGTFDLVTGSTAITTTIKAPTTADSNRVSGNISIMAGI